MAVEQVVNNIIEIDKLLAYVWIFMLCFECNTLVLVLSDPVAS